MALSTAQMARMSRLLDEALELDEAGRRRWLEALGEQDRDLESALRAALLPRDQPTLATLPKLPADLSVEPSLRAGARVGPYELVRPVGKGGMAQVWLAKRADGAYEREVALKLPVAFHLRGDLAKRFARERDILAGLEHPGIARFYDAGVGSDGLPYFAMEYVPGKPLTAWCDAARLGIAERLKLFLEVLEAVQFAHERGVLHRDIKPSNVLVTESGQPRLLDFGVARMFQQTDMALTMEYGRALTPEYASPEQMREAETGPVSDVYSLGILLYHLLCGELPYRLEGGKLPTELPAVERPSTRANAQAASSRMQTPPRLALALRGDLDAIVMKALAPEPGRRYESAQALAQDIRRNLERRPVLARPATLPYRTGKFFLRNRAATVAGALGLTVAALSLSHAYTVPERRTSPGLVVSDKSIAVLPFIDMSEHHDQEYFSDGLSEELIDRLSHSPELRVIARTSSFSFKHKRTTIEQIAKALNVSHLLEGSVRKSGTTMRVTAELVRASDGTNLWSQTYDRTVEDVFRVQDEIAGAVSSALEITMNSESGEGKTHRPTSRAHEMLLLGDLLWYRYRVEDSPAAHLYYLKAVEADPNYALAWARLGKSYAFNESITLTYPERLHEAKKALAEGLRLDRQLVSAHWTLANIYIYYEWDWAAAQAEIESMHKLEPSNQFELPETVASLAQVLGRTDEAISAFREVLARHPFEPNRYSDLASVLYQAGQFPGAVEQQRQAIQLNPRGSWNYGFLGLYLLYAGKPQEALEAMQTEGDEATRLAWLALPYWKLGRRQESDAAMLVAEEKLCDKAPFALAMARAYRGDVDAAFKWLERAYRQHDPLLANYVKLEPTLLDLHSDPRFDALLAHMKLPTT
jgi:serine/threonine protein kinase/tetratricopeptide (TPR) repeat protein